MPLPGVAIEAQTDGAIVRSKDPAFANVMRNVLGPAFSIMPLGKTSWHVMPGRELQTAMTPAQFLAAKAATAEYISQMLGDPLDFQVQKNGTGVNVTVPEPEHHHAFVQRVVAAFAGDDEFVVSRLSSLVLQISVPKPKPQRMFRQNFGSSRI